MEKSCSICLHFDVCKFKPDPYMGSHSGGFSPTCGYEEYRDRLFEFKAKYCSWYIKPLFKQEII